MGSKLRAPSEADMKNAEKWLEQAMRDLKINEFHRVKRLCKQTIRALRRKENENV